MPDIRKNIFACLFRIRNAISLSRHEQVCLSTLRFERYFSHHRALNISSAVLCCFILADQFIKSSHMSLFC